MPKQKGESMYIKYSFDTDISLCGEVHVLVPLLDFCWCECMFQCFPGRVGEMTHQMPK